MKRMLVLLGIISSIHLNAQTGIGTTTPNASAKLDVYSDNKGFLPPRVTLSSVTDNTTISSPAEGLLVYNKGSVGLQAGYYYWNGANWATIATATSAGNGVIASDMVKLYGEAHSTATGKMGNTNGYPFTVPVSGRYLFDFTSSATTLNGGTNTIYFQVRQGTTVLGSDMQSSYNNNVHVEYNGKIEVNLQAGVSYNVYNYATSGSFETNDYDRVYYKQVSGNLPITGQTVDYVSVTRTSAQTVNSGDNILFNQTNGGNIPYNSSTGAFTLIAGKTYRLTGYVALSSANSTAEEVNVAWKTGTGDILSNKGDILSTNLVTTAASAGVADVIYTPTANTTVSLHVPYSSGNSIVWSNMTYAIVQQIGSSAIINPWVLSGNDVYNTTGEVGIGNSNPNATLDVRATPTSTTDPGVGYMGVGTTTKTAASAGAGAIRYNATTSKVEASNGSIWQSSNAPIFAQFEGNATQTITTIGTKINFPTTRINVGGITIASNNTITLPAGRIYRIDLNIGWLNMGGTWTRFAIYNAGVIASVPTHTENGTGNYGGTGTTTTFINTSAGSTTIDVRYLIPSGTTVSVGDTGNGSSFPFITIQAVD